MRSDLNATIDELLQRGMAVMSADSRVKITSLRTIPHATTGFFDALDKSRDVWIAAGWALEPETKEPSSYVIAVQDGAVCRQATHEKLVRGDVNQALQIPMQQAAGFRVSFRPNSPDGRVTLIAVLPSGELAVLPGPASVTAAANGFAGHGVALSEMDWKAKCARPLYAFPRNSPFHGLYSFESNYDASQMDGVTDQFLEDATTYHQKYTEHARWRLLLSQAFLRTDVDERRALSVLDVGSGSGNTVVPLLELLPNSSVIATDISPQLLAILRDQLTDSDRQRVCLIAMDAAEKSFQRDTFDLIAGAAILHHIIDPSHTLAACSESLKPGGHAIFFEAFEEGYLLLRLLYEQLVEKRAELSLSDEVVQVLQALILDCDVRKGADKSADFYRHIDDKWSFTRSYFERQRRKHGYSRVEFFPLDVSTARFSAQLRTHLRLCLGRGDDALTPQAWAYVADFEKKVSPDLYSDLLMEACVILTK